MGSHTVDSGWLKADLKLIGLHVKGDLQLLRTISAKDHMAEIPAGIRPPRGDDPALDAQSVERKNDTSVRLISPMATESIGIDVERYASPSS